MKPNFYLEGINPLRRLDQQELVNRIEMGERGYYSLLQWTYRAFEKRDPIIRAVKKRLMASLGSLKWDIKLADVGEDAEKEALAKKQAATLRSAYDAIANLREALNFLALAELRGFSHLEKVYAGAIDSRTGAPFDAKREPWDVVELRIVEQWFWSRRGLYGPWLYNGDARDTNTGETIDLAGYVIHAVDDPADEIFAEYGTKRRVNDADWDGFLFDYGNPTMFIVLPPNVPKDREAEYQRAAEQAVSAARGSLPNGSSLVSPNATGAGGAGIFKERLDYIDGQIVIAGTAGKLTVLSESGSGTLAGGAQKEAFDEIAQAIADQLSGVLQKQFDLPLLQRLHPDEPVLAYFEFAAVDEGDVSEHVDNAEKLARAGFAIDDAELSEKSGYKLTYVGPPNVAAKGAAGTPEVSPQITGAISTDSEEGVRKAGTQEYNLRKSVKSVDENSATAALADQLDVTETFVAPAKSILDNLLAQAQRANVTDAQLLASAEEILQRIPELAVSTDISEMTDALTRMMEAAAEATLTGA